MFNWLHKRLEPEDGETAVLNSGLALAIEWGEDFLKPIQPRLAGQYPQLTPEQLDEVNTICQAAMRAGHDKENI